MSRSLLGSVSQGGKPGRGYKEQAGTLGSLQAF